MVSDHEEIASPEMGEDPYTQQYYDQLRTNGFPEEKIEGIRKRARQNNPTLTSYFVHEARNALGIFKMYQEANLPIDAKMFEESRNRLVHVREAFDWHKHEGKLSKPQISAFLDETDKEGSWDLEKVKHIQDRFDELVNPPKSLPED